MIKVFLILIFIKFSQSQAPAFLIWHSAGNCYESTEVNNWRALLKSQFGENVHVKSAKLAESVKVDCVASLTTHPFIQIEKVCREIQMDPKFQNGYNIIGLSQGGVLARGLAEICPFPRIINLVTFGSPHQGIAKVPTCENSNRIFCQAVTKFVETASRTLTGQNLFSLFTLWRSDDSDVYKSTNTYLSVINNEVNYNRNFVENLLSLRRIILVKHSMDKSVIPNESAWFGYKNEFGNEIPLEDTKTYINDNLGLQSMVANGKLLRLEEPGGHINFNPIWIIENIMPYLIES